MKVIKREIQDRIESKLFEGKLIIIYGPRRSGKTTLSKLLSEKYKGKYINCEEPYIQDAFTSAKSTLDLKNILGGGNFFVLDEAQSVEDMGRKLKLLVDTYPEIQIIATGSSSFDLSNKIIEPLTGRKYEFTLYPFSISELMVNLAEQEIQANTNNFLRYGLYPSIFQKNYLDIEDELNEVTGSYLFKDILTFQEVKNPQMLRKLLQAIALQIGGLVSYNELATLLGIDKNTVARYIDLLEKSFIIFTLTPFSRNLRKELGTNRKIYFYDNGIRNSLINQFNIPELRDDVGGIWESFCVMERKKFIENKGLRFNQYFWRTYDQKEIDLVEEKDGTFNIFEFKYSKDTVKFPKDWLENYPTQNSILVNKYNYLSELFRI